MKNNVFYLNLNRKLRADRKAVRAIVFVNKYVTLYIFALFFVMNIYLLAKNRYLDLTLTILLCGSGFVTVSILRKLIARKRPYATFSYEPILNGKGALNSMPSRHTYSVFVIAFSSFLISPRLFVFNVLCGVLLAIVRILGGVHYISDVLIAFVLAITFGVTFFLV